ncbi:MAG: DNA repair protein RadC [Bacilli bacterium]|nr:DNA repair protein RadC [Bacilli bacterium]
MFKVMIKDIPNEEKPRERFLKYGKDNISNEDLIAIILKTGTINTSVKTLSNLILSNINNISDLKDLNISNLSKIKGIGQVKSIELIASIELGRRVYYEKQMENKIKLDNPSKIYEYFKYLINDNKQEYFYCLYLDNQKNLIDKKLLFIGTINMSVVHPREIFKYAYLLSATSIICIHNHPSGNSAPSFEDIKLTKSLKEIGNNQGIKINDHIIIGNDNYYSFFENDNI